MHHRNLEGETDASLMAAVLRRRQQALQEVYRRHSGAMLALSQRLLNNRTLAEDVVQEVFVRLWHSPDRFDAQRGSLRSYLLADAHGRAVDLIRSETSRRRREGREAENSALTSPSPERDIELLAVSKEVRTAVERLSDTERTAIMLSYFGGKTYREVAQFLGVPEGTIKTRIRSGLRRLRLVLTDAEVFP